jgi:membrane-associated phospholipid phosphatase
MTFPIPIPKVIDDFDKKMMDKVKTPEGVIRYLSLGITAFGSAPVTVSIELLGWFFAAPLLQVWFGLSLLADVPGHLLVIVPCRYIFQRQRPTPFTKAPLYFDVWNIFSFPSAHSLRTWTLATIWCFGYPQLNYLFIIIATVITGTRIVLRRHYPSDIIVGAILGVLLGFIMVKFFPGGIVNPF